MLGGLSASFGRRPQDEEHESACVWRLLTKLGAWGSATLARVQGSCKAEAAAQARPNGGSFFVQSAGNGTPSVKTSVSDPSRIFRS